MAVGGGSVAQRKLPVHLVLASVGLTALVVYMASLFIPRLMVRSFGAVPTL
jgi:hypothetical protein